ncbi:MAG: ATP-binding protein [Prolixibacteraceae bacterium]|nr:ATP-binding protein [Prolixibacteraceae bacterium]
MKKIVITGPESTGKTTLAEELARKLNASLIPEYARSYIEKLDRPYNISDVEIIARHQVDEEKRFSETGESGILLMDTWLIVTKIWFEVVFGEAPAWIEKHISTDEIDLFLVCAPDIPWVADPVRENGGEMRLILFDRYIEEIEKQGFVYETVTGFGKIRLNNAWNHLKSHGIV